MNYETARKNLIEQHIRPWNVYRTDVIKSLYNVPRENFVPNKYKKYALSDLQVPLNGNDSMLSPMVALAMPRAMLHSLWCCRRNAQNMQEFLMVSVTETRQICRNSLWWA